MQVFKFAGCLTLSSLSIGVFLISSGCSQLSGFGTLSDGPASTQDMRKAAAIARAEADALDQIAALLPCEARVDSLPESQQLVRIDEAAAILIGEAEDLTQLGLGACFCLSNGQSFKCISNRCGCLIELLLQPLTPLLCLILGLACCSIVLIEPALQQVGALQCFIGLLSKPALQQIFTLLGIPQCLLHCFVRFA